MKITPRLCVCGCGGYVKETGHKETKYIRGHHRAWLGKKRPEMIGNTYGFKKGQHPWNMGVSVPEEQKERQRQKMIGRKIWGGHRKNMTWTIGKNNKLWKGDNVGYISLHTWLRRNYGKASKCEFCDTKKAKRYEWANKSGEYKRDISDWIQLCTKCHRKYDVENNWGMAVKKYTERTRNASL